MLLLHWLYSASIVTHESRHCLYSGRASQVTHDDGSWGMIRVIWRDIRLVLGVTVGLLVLLQAAAPAPTLLLLHSLLHTKLVLSCCMIDESD